MFHRFCINPKCFKYNVVDTYIYAYPFLVKMRTNPGHNYRTEYFISNFASKEDGLKHRVEIITEHSPICYLHTLVLFLYTLFITDCSLIALYPIYTLCVKQCTLIALYPIHTLCVKQCILIALYPFYTLCIEQCTLIAHISFIYSLC